MVSIITLKFCTDKLKQSLKKCFIISFKFNITTHYLVYEVKNSRVAKYVHIFLLVVYSIQNVFNIYTSVHVELTNCILNVRVLIGAKFITKI